jgi:undecaprenyl-diphosphatase
VASHEQTRLADMGAVLIGGCIAAIVVLYIFVWLADQVLDQSTKQIDVGVLVYLQRFASPELTLLARGISLLGNEAIWVFGLALMITFGWQRRWGAAVSVIAVAVGAQLLNDALKAMFHRARPEPLLGLISAQSYSFPSGHAMESAAFYTYVGYLGWRLLHGHWRVVLLVLLGVLVALVGLSRLYLEAHYLSDVLGGYLAGFLWTDTVLLAARVLVARPTRRPQARPAPP